MRVLFSRDRDFTPPEDRRMTVAYKGDREYTVKRAWGEAMVAAGDCVEVSAPPREGEPGSREKRPLSPAQVKALDGDGDGAAGGSLPKAERG